MAFTSVKDSTGLLIQSSATMNASDQTIVLDPALARFWVHCLTTNTPMYFAAASAGGQPFTLVAGGTPIEFRLPELAGQSLTFNAATGTVEIIQELLHH